MAIHFAYETIVDHFERPGKRFPCIGILIKKLAYVGFKFLSQSGQRPNVPSCGSMDMETDAHDRYFQTIAKHQGKIRELWVVPFLSKYDMASSIPLNDFT